MKYRAILVDPDAKAERPQQMFANDIAQCRNWATLKLATAETPDACVNIYQSVEQQVALILKPKPAAPAAAKGGQAV